MGDHGIPGLTRAHGEIRGAHSDVFDRAANGHFEGEAGPSGVGDEQIAAPAHDQQRKAIVIGKGNRLPHLGLGQRHHEITGRATHLQGSQRRQRNVLLKNHGFVIIACGKAKAFSLCLGDSAAIREGFL